MASKLRTPALVVALIAAVLIVLVETGASWRASAGLFDGLGGRVEELRSSFEGLGSDGGGEPLISDFSDLESMLSTESEDLPGMAVAALIDLDLMLMVTLLLFNLPLVISPRLIAQCQGCISLILGIVVLFLALVTILKALVNLFLMIALLLAIPFGTIVYMIQYADFDTTEATAILSTLMFLKTVLAVAILVAHERFLVNLGFIALVATSFLAMIIIGFLHNFPPTFLVSITDVVAAIIVAILALLWGIIYLVGGIVGIVIMIKGMLT